MAEDARTNPSEPEVPSSAAMAAEDPKPAETPAKSPASEAAAAAEECEGFAESVSFEEESNIVANLEDPEKKALDELRTLIQSAVANNDFTPPLVSTATEAIAVAAEGATSAAAATEAAEPPKEVTESGLSKSEEQVFIWGVLLLGDERSDTVLLKFLRARDFKVKDALAMIKSAVAWRKEFGIDALIEEDLEVPELEKVAFNHGLDREGHPVCYNAYGEFRSRDLYAKAFGNEESREKFLRWRIQYLEKGIRERLDFGPGAVSTMVQVTDLKNLPGPGKKELRLATKKALALLQDNYPEFVAKQVFINVPWWYLTYNRMISPFFTQRSKSKFVFAGPSKSADTLFKYIAPEQVPVQYGGLSKESDPDFSAADAVTEATIKPASKQTVEMPATKGEVLVWELRVLGWEVSYAAEFVPTAEDGYTVIVQKARKFAAADEPYVKNSFKVGEAGKVVLTIDNATSKKKKLLYRSKTKTAT